jgi:DNA-binding transcriptional regulator LsrR (DeoR family)
MTLDMEALARYGDQQREATRARDRAIRDAVKAGASLREVATAVGLSHMGVSRIVQRAREA